MKFIPHSAKADSFSLFRAAKRPRNVAQASGLPYRSASSLLPRAPASRVRLKKISPALSAIIAVFLSVALPAGAREKLAVHEWGTFTSLLDEEGTAIGGINTDDEPVPKFVHRISQELLLRRTEAPPQFFQGAPSCHPDVTMRLETPVLYFHPAENAPAQMIEVRVEFPGGWLTEFYPDAEVKAPGFAPGSPDPRKKVEYSRIGRISPGAIGELRWAGLTVGAAGEAPETDAPVWLAPRQVSAATVRAANGEAEKFLFYRGVAKMSPPVRVSRAATGATLRVTDARPLELKAGWLVSVRPDGACAFRSTGPMPAGEVRATLPAQFGEQEHAAENMARLREEMRVALVQDGLFADEAEALLQTWELSYFKSAGLRFFYLCPRAEIDAALPLEISTPAEITRVMLGRIEIVTPEQRALLSKIARGPAPEVWKMRLESDTETYLAVAGGKKPLSAMGKVPELYADYLRLGRFRNALLLDGQRRRPTKDLADFIEKNQLQGYAAE